MVKKENIKQLLNLSFVEYTNQTYLMGEYDLPYATCPNLICIDYFALFSETYNYQKTNNTCVCFYQYDNEFDGINGLFNAIYYREEKLLEKYKNRLKNVKYVVAPDYSQCGDIPRIENIYRLFKSRIVSNWLLLECNIVVIPNITYANENYFDVMLSGMEDTEIVAISTKGSIKEPKEKELLLKAIKYTTDNLHQLKKFFVYSVCSSDDTIHKLFEYPSSKGIEIVVPSNTLKERNVASRKARQNGQDKK